ncbi:MBL fold metallo-hydrolase [uncultured Bacteroides sp.]|uniref:MBL fold metallo-hydrolase n=1 Tax=uncultured Bacteroides sp. TaxID=162156 RepID=UPI002AA7E40F|nr:MBL fold metallo-hydrolase [uncultured Bacteroides sp.]
MNLALTIHRGTNEIGGSCVEIATATTKILIDIGLPLDSKASEDNLNLYNPGIEDNIDAVFISHYHLDHYGLLPLLDESIPVYASEGTKKIFEINNVFLHQKEMKNLKVIKPQDEIIIKDISIIPYTVDHSAYDAMAFLIEAEGKRILYSGDIRLHGPKSKLYKYLPKEVDYMILEGTNINNEVYNIKTEKDIEEEFLSIFRSTSDAINYVWCSGQNIDRLVALYRACVKSKKIMVVDVYVANVLKEIHGLNNKIPFLNSHDNMGVYYPKYVTNNLKNSGHWNYAIRLDPNHYKVTPEMISADPGKYVVVVRPSVLEFLKKCTPSNGNLITSLWKEYEKRDENKRLIEWAKAKNYNLYSVHTSGHASLNELKEIVTMLKPKKIIPIHTEHKEKFKEHFTNVLVIEDCEPLLL